MQCTCLLVAAITSILPKPRVHLSIMRRKQLVGVAQSTVCIGIKNSHYGVVDNLDHN
jgi:hypothetical protein